MAALILIVEDSDDVTPLEIALASLGSLRTQVVKNGRDALRVLENSPAHVAAIITDLNLPFVDGLELIRAVRGNLGLYEVPIVVVTGDNDAAIQTRVRSLGANAFFVKPYSPAAIRQKLEDLLHA